MKCPHCSIAFHARWNEWFVEADDSARYKAEYEEASNRNFAVDSTQCPECQKLIFRLSTFPSLPEPVPIPPEDSFIVYPHGVAPRPVPTEVGKKFGDDFDEACRVLPISQKASAALSRRCLQNLLREKAKVKPSTLAREIQEAIKTNSFPGNLEKSLDAVRSVGNFAAHPIKDQHTGEVIEVEAGEAEWLLDILEELFYFYFVQPARMEKRVTSLNKKLDAAGKPLLR